MTALRLFSSFVKWMRNVDYFTQNTRTFYRCRCSITSLIAPHVIEKKKSIKSKKVKTGCNLAESSKEDSGPTRIILSIMMMIVHRTESRYKYNFVS
jgi:hypothetical protein